MITRKIMWAIGLCLTLLCIFNGPPSALAAAAKQVKPKGPYASPTPKYLFATTLKEQEAQLKSNALLQRFAMSRAAVASDTYRPAYHFVSPESSLNNPNGLSFWQGRWHLIYQAYPPDELPDLKDISKRRQRWGHSVSDDLVRWRDLPYAIYPGVEKMAFSGGTLVEKDRVIALYPGVGMGKPNPPIAGLSAAMMVATSSDPLLLNWTKSAPVEIPEVWDTDIWKQGDLYYGVVGSLDPYRADTSVKPVGALSKVVRRGGMAPMETLDIQGSQKTEAGRRSSVREDAVHRSL